MLSHKTVIGSLSLLDLIAVMAGITVYTAEIMAKE